MTVTEVGRFHYRFARPVKPNETLRDCSQSNLSVQVIPSCSRPSPVRLGSPASSLLGRCGAVLAYTILIVDDSAVIRRLVRTTIERNSNWNICGEAENGAVAVEKVKELCPDVVILDLQMPVMDGMAAARQIALIAPKTEMLMFTMHNSEQVAKAARASGIKTVISKTYAPAAQILAFLKSYSKVSAA